MRNDEIERKFLVTGDGWRGLGSGTQVRQGYVVFGPPVSVRVRVMGEQGYLTLKRALDEGSSGAPLHRLEFEYEIPVDEAAAMLEAVCAARVDKTRYRIDHEGRLWEVDEFEGANAGLVVAEIELESADAEFARPPWLGEEVSGDARYLNVNLARRPYRDWGSP